MKTICAIVALGSLILVNSAMGQVGAVISVDEWGHGIGTVGQGYLEVDPGPGGVPGKGVLTYNLPFLVIPGDVWLNEGTTGLHSDLLRFNTSPNGQSSTLVFYSDLDAVFEPADAAFPQVNYPNPVSLMEVDPFNTYVPAIGIGPGDFNRTTYNFYSDTQLGGVPEGGATIGLLLIGLAGLFGLKRK